MRKLPEHPAVSIGPIAAEIVAAGGEVDVIAVFERSFYLLAPRGIIAVCMADLGNGPLNILVKSPAGTPPWDGLVRVEMKATVSADQVIVHGGFAVSLNATARWQPPPMPPWDRQAADRGLSAVRGHAARLAPSDGLAPLVFMPANKTAATATGLAARDLVRDVKADLPKALQTKNWSAAAQRGAVLLVGLGPGLTPSGDDFLGGLMLGLTARGAIPLRDALWDIIADELDDLTVPVSAMHLTAAADGVVSDALHHLLNAVLSDQHDALPARLDAVTKIGATSGWDALAGLVLALEA